MIANERLFDCILISFECADRGVMTALDKALPWANAAQPFNASRLDRSGETCSRFF